MLVAVKSAVNVLRGEYEQLVVQQMILGRQRQMQQPLVVQQHRHVVGFRLHEERRLSVSTFEKFRMITDLQNVTFIQK